MATRQFAALVFSCEHGGNRIPPRYKTYFVKYQAELASHLGYDIGALALARDFAQVFDSKLIAATTSRLLIDLNRSLGHRDLHFGVLKKAPQAVRDEIVERYYRPYRDAVHSELARLRKRARRVIHVSVHTFAPALHNVERSADIGLLYDPRREREQTLVFDWQRALRAAMPDMKVRRNYPYAGRADGLTTALRRLHDDDVYAGIELEVNQKHVLAGPKYWRKIRLQLVRASRVAFKTAT